jgi:general stress protein 26
MPTPTEMKEKFWKAVKSDRTMMLGLAGVDDAHTRPMTAMLDGDEGPIWFFTSTDTLLVQQIKTDSRATATFVDKGHNLFASVQGRLVRDTNPAMVEKLWNPFIAAWFEGGKTDPKLALLRFDAEDAEIWYDASNLLSAIKMLVGIDPKQSYKDNVAEVQLT